jgi:hypothetical protein
LKTVSFPENDKDLIRVHYVQTYKRWNYRQYIYVCSHLSYFDRSDLEGVEDEIEERYGLQNSDEEDKARTSLFDDVENAQKHSDRESPSKKMDFDAEMHAMLDASLREEGEAELEEGELLAQDQDMDNGYQQQNVFKVNKRKKDENVDDEDEEMQQHYSFGFQDDEEIMDDYNESAGPHQNLNCGGKSSPHNQLSNKGSNNEQEPSCIVLDSSSE